MGLMPCIWEPQAMGQENQRVIRLKTFPVWWIFAHRFRAKVYVTVNTIVYENELFQVENYVATYTK